jgi:hypothetical protein
VRAAVENCAGMRMATARGREWGATARRPRFRSKSGGEIAGRRDCQAKKVWTPGGLRKQRRRIKPLPPADGHRAEVQSTEVQSMRGALRGEPLLPNAPPNMRSSHLHFEGHQARVRRRLRPVSMSDRKTRRPHSCGNGRGRPNHRRGERATVWCESAPATGLATLRK